MTTQTLRLVFMGTPDFSVPVLASLIDAGHVVVCVYTRPPRPAGRGYKERPSPVHAFALSRGLALRTAKTLKDPERQAAFAALDADAAVVAAYGLILPPPILDAPRLGCLNVHPSLLPRWRGAAPIQRAILAGDEETGVTVIRMDPGLDTGDILLSERIAITADATAQTLYDDLAKLGARLVVEALEGLAQGRLEARPQPAEGVTFADKLVREEGRLDWNRPAAELERLVRAFTPWPGAWFEAGGGKERERIKVLAAALAEDPRRHAPGTVADERLTVSCGDGALRILRLQRAGRAALDAETFLRGYSIPAATVLPPG